MATLWHGRFEGGPADELLAFTVSLPVRPAPRARRHRRVRAPTCAAWRAIGVLTDAERDEVLAALDQVEAELADGTFAFVPSDEDIHTAVERRVTELAGAAGPSSTPAAAATTRSRPTSASTPSGRCSTVAERVVALQQVLLDRAERGRRRLPARATRTSSGPSR